MQLCRFALIEDPGTPRSGIYHDGRFFETDGEQAVGVHEISKIILLPPMQTAASLRVFDEGLSYRYRNSAVFGGTLTEFDAPTGEVLPEIRVVAILKDAGEMIDAEEAEGFVLGYSLYFTISTKAADDFPFAIGPFLTIPEGSPAELLSQPLTVKVNGNVTMTGPPNVPDFASMIAQASRTNRTSVSDLIAAPALLLDGLGLHPGDTIQVIHDGLGALTAKVV